MRRVLLTVTLCTTLAVLAAPGVAQASNPSGVGAASPATVAPGGATLLTVAVTPGTEPDSTGIQVACNLFSIGGVFETLYDDGTHGDAAAGDDTFSFLATVPTTAPLGPHSIHCFISDSLARTGTADIALDIELVQNQPPTVDAGGPYVVDEGGSVGLSATGSDPEGGSLTYAWDLDDDGTFETPGPSATFSAALIDGPATRSVEVQVTDEGGLSSTEEATVTVQNVAPTATFESPASAPAGFDFSLALTSPSDPSAADTAAGFTYAFDCGSGYGAFGPNPAASCSATETGGRSVGGQIRDKDGGVTEYRATVEVTVTFGSLCELTRAYSAKTGVAEALCSKLRNAADTPNAHARDGLLGAYQNEVDAQTGKSFTAGQALVLNQLAVSLQV